MNPEILKLFYTHTFNDILVTITLIFFSVFLTIYSSNALKLNKFYTLVIFLTHNLMFPIYMLFLIKFGSDSLTYFINNQGYNYLDVKSGQIFMNKIVIFFNFFKFNFYNTNYLFSIFSLFGIYLYLKIIQDLKINNKFDKYLILVFLCLPSIHFWHMGFSKDTITFFFISLTIYEIQKSNKNIIVIIFSLIALYFVRPHISLIVFISLFCFYFINNENILFRIIISILALLFSILILRAIFDFTSVQSIFKFLSIFKDQYIQNEVTALPSDMNFLLRVISYIFLPNIIAFKDLSLFYIIVLLENTFLIFVFLKVLTFNFFSKKKFKEMSFLIFFSLISLLILTYVTSNLGIATRQKWIFLPALFILFSVSKYKLR